MKWIISNVMNAYIAHIKGDDISAAAFLQASGELGKSLYIRLIKELGD